MNYREVLNGMNYHVALKLTPDQLFDLKMMALKSGRSITELATQAVLEKLYPDTSSKTKEEE